MTLADHVAAHETEGVGAERVDRTLGIHAMPPGYALMRLRDDDSCPFYWLRDDGAASDLTWDRWAVWRWAMHDAKERGR